MDNNKPNQPQVNRWILRLPIVTPSGNETIRQHWAARSEHKSAMGWMLASCLNGQPKIPFASGKRRLTIERHGKRSLDMDNLASGCKSLIDCIKERRLILDDSPEVCEMVFRQVTVSKCEPTYTLVTLENIDSLRVGV
jgi:hypothetical protein